VYYIYQILAFVLIGVSLGALAGDRKVLVPSLLGIICAILVFVMQAWWPLLAGAVVFLGAQAIRRDAVAS